LFCSRCGSSRYVESRVTIRIDTDELLDVILLVLSLIIATLQKPLVVIKVVLPYVALLVLFAGFVVWNGSVVLGKRDFTSPYGPKPNIDRG
jgi:hypothetical protein